MKTLQETNEILRNRNVELLAKADGLGVITSGTTADGKLRAASRENSRAMEKRRYGVDCADIDANRYDKMDYTGCVKIIATR